MDKKLKYEIKWDDYIVGRVYINDNNEYTYIPDEKNIEITIKLGMPAIFVKTPQKEWKKTLPKFIENRLKLNKKDDCKLVTDRFSIIEK